MKCTKFFRWCSAEIPAVFEERRRGHRKRSGVWMSNTRRTCSSGHVV